MPPESACVSVGTVAMWWGQGGGGEIAVPAQRHVLMCLRVCLWAYPVSPSRTAQRAQVKLLEEERHKVSMDLKERAARATVLRQK